MPANRFGMFANRFGMFANRFGMFANRFGMFANRFRTVNLSSGLQTFLPDHKPSRQPRSLSVSLVA
ncbi:hypothetical protein [Hymenobacter sp. IS2118]|uniref:hypothetical protein n=1 Tax=Hymenobacter sp. IS2118 TaxID=1505605 RepID=UPI0012695FEE|nr:hypothetical protein [Hymenobacter sp. IS2118]